MVAGTEALGGLETKYASKYQQPLIVLLALHRDGAKPGGR